MTPKAESESAAAASLTARSPSRKNVPPRQSRAAVKLNRAELELRRPKIEKPSERLIITELSVVW